MNVVVVAQQLRRHVPGGIGTYARGLLQGLAELQPTDLSVTLHASRPPAAPDPLEAWGHAVRASRLPGPALTRAWDRGLLGAPDGDAIHAVSLAFPPPGDRPLVVFVHDLAWREVPDAYPARGRRWHERSLRRALGSAARLVVPSRQVADQLLAAGASPGTVDVVEEGCDHLPPADVDAADELLERIGAPRGFLLAVSTLEPRKNLIRLVQAYERARTDLAEPWPLVVVGPAGWGDALPPAGVPHGVLLAGHVAAATLAGLYRRCRCLAYVPLAEGFGLPPVEAMRECAPVVASTVVPSARGASLEVDPLDPADIGRGLVAASSDDRVRSELVTAGLLRSGELTWMETARRHVEIWRATQ